MSELLDEIAGQDVTEDESAAVESVEAVEAEPETEMAAPVTEAEQPKPAEKTVPLATLLEERAAKKQLQEKLQTFEQEIRQIREQRQQVEQPVKEDAAPDYLQDPKGYIEWQRRQAEQAINKELEPIRQQYQQSEQQRQQEAIASQISTKAGEYEAEFIEAQPDYYDALQHIRNLRIAEAQALGMQPQQISMALRNQELQLAAFALQNGKNPAVLAYNLAKSLGYGQQLQQAAPIVTEEAKADMAAKREKAQGMGGSGGASIDSILGASNEEFEEAMAEMFGKRK